MQEVNRKIKVVRRGEAVARPARKPVVKSARETAREMVSNVSVWVTDLKERKSLETKAAIEKLFPINPHTNES